MQMFLGKKGPQNIEPKTWHMLSILYKQNAFCVFQSA